MCCCFLKNIRAWSTLYGFYCDSFFNLIFSEMQENNERKINFVNSYDKNSSFIKRANNLNNSLMVAIKIYHPRANYRN